MTHNLPASIESATSALGALADHTTEIADVLAMAFGLPFAQVAPVDSRYGTVTANVERLAGSLDAIAKTAEAASSRLLGLARPVQLDPRPEPCQCQPAAETLTVPAEAIEYDEPEASPALRKLRAGVANWGASEYDACCDPSCKEYDDDDDDDEEKTGDGRKAVPDPSESVIHRDHIPPASSAALPEIEEPGGPKRRPRNRGKAKRK